MVKQIGEERDINGKRKIDWMDQRGDINRIGRGQKGAQLRSKSLAD
jgi:hypothetical protein